MKGIRIRPEKSGLGALLFDLEAEVMEVVWGRNWNAFTVAEVLEALQEHREIAYTTVMTTLKRLTDKGVLGRRRKGKRHVYRPILGRDEFSRELAREVLNSMPVLGQEAAISLLIDRIAEADAKGLDALEALIEAKRNEGER